MAQPADGMRGGRPPAPAAALAPRGWCGGRGGQLVQRAADGAGPALRPRAPGAGQLDGAGAGRLQAAAFHLERRLGEAQP